MSDSNDKITLGLGIIMVSIILIGKVNMITNDQIKHIEILPPGLEETTEFNNTQVYFYTDSPTCLTVRKQSFNDCIYSENAQTTYTIETPANVNVCPENPSYNLRRQRDVFTLDQNPNCTVDNAFSILPRQQNTVAITNNDKFLTADLVNHLVTLNGTENVQWKICQLSTTANAYVIKVAYKDLYISVSNQNNTLVVKLVPWTVAENQNTSQLTIFGIVKGATIQNYTNYIIIGVAIVVFLYFIWNWASKNSS